MINERQQVLRRILLGIMAVMIVASVWIVDQAAQADPMSASQQVAQVDAPANQTNAPAAATGSSAAESPKSFMEIVFSGGWAGFLIILLLLGLSLTAAYLVFEQLMTLRRAEIIPAGLGERFRELLAQSLIHI